MRDGFFRAHCGGSLVTGSVQDPSSKSQSLKTKRAVFLLYAVFCLARFGLVAAAQQSTYSADSSMEALKKGPKISLKGSETTLTDVVVESKKSSVLFGSSGNHKVSCELASPTDNVNAKLLVGSPLTVFGKVRARGILGNAASDYCSPASGAATSDSNSSDIAPVEPVATQAAPEQSEEQPEIPVENPSESRDTETITPGAEPVSRWKSLSRKVAVPVRKLVAVVLPSERPSGKTTEQSNVTGEAGLTKAAPSLAFYVRVAALACFALLVFVKLRRAFTPRRLRTRNKPISPEIRRAAIEALLSGKKMRWRDRWKFKRA